MLFNSISFAIFLPVVFFLYWFVVKRLQYQNMMLLVASYFFYACWDWRFLFLLMFSTLLDYFTGIMMSKTTLKSNRRFWFWLSVCVNLGFLGIFKYYNFFIGSFTELLSQFGLTVHPATIKVILPVGISFYTFHGLSYVIDIYKNKIKCERNFVDYAVFVSFFPLLVAGPIERATHLLPQIKQKRNFNYADAVNGLRQILWGLFKKIVIADNCAEYANLIFNNSSEHSGSTLVLGAIFFAVQIYGDFSGYSDIALGSAKLLGITLLRNFAFPYFSRDIAEFWRRWHISLTTWFRDYLYIPLGGSREGMAKAIRNTFIIFLVSGFWHGANWTFIVWGAIHACYFLPLLLSKNNRKNIEIVAKGKLFPSFREFIQILTTFILTVFAWIFFRAENLTHAFHYLTAIFDKTLFSIPPILSIKMCIVFLLVTAFFLIEWMNREKEFALQQVEVPNKKSIVLRWSLYIAIIVCIICLGGSTQNFIYFQF